MPDSPLTIAFFSNHFARSAGTGIARYARGLVESFARLDAPVNLIPVATWSNREKGELQALKAESGLRVLPTGRWLTPLLWKSIGVPRLEQLLDVRIDMVHECYLGYVTATAKPFVITVHDIGPLTHPEYFGNNSSPIVEKNLKYAVNVAMAFICVSQSSADSLMDYVQRRYSVDLSKRTYVVHEGICQGFFEAPDLSILDGRDEFDFWQQPYILTVGKISPRKNIEAILRALSRLGSRIPHHLVAVGGDGWDYQGVKKMAHALGLADRVHFLGYVSDDTLNALYSRAALFLYPSLFEGFGLPVLEAMACGCPVITSNISSLPEVAGEAALLVDPHNIAEIAASTECVCMDPNFADELRRKGRAQAKLFSWTKCAQEVAEIYNGLIS